MIELNSLWESVQKEFRKTTGSVTYNNLIAPAKAISLENNQLTIELPTKSHRDFWQNEMTAKLKDLLFNETLVHIEPRYTLERELMTPSSPAGGIMTKQTPLNPEYTFEAFVEGRSNQMAYASAYAASEQPGGLYNPLLIYGGVGLGKTHLMQAIANNMLRHNPNAKIKYVTSETFTNDYINSIKNNNQEQFRREYRDLDALLVDDVQFFSNKEGTQLEFFNTFNSLHDNNKQIVLTADRNPKQIPDLTDRLVSRFVWGVPVEITSPDLETRTAILRSKAEEEQINVPNDVLSFIASKVDTNVRELESALLRVRVAAQLHHAPITIELANETLKGMEAADEAVISIDLIQKKVA
ncbi:chromosomal replication initiator protein DnaA, partial [Limosilactobacillus mucosae]